MAQFIYAILFSTLLIFGPQTQAQEKSTALELLKEAEGTSVSEKPSEPEISEEMETLPQETENKKSNSKSKSTDSTSKKRFKNIYAILTIKMGEEKLEPIKIRLFHSRAPKTVANFVGLAEGTKQYFSKGRKLRGRFYDGLKFHRVIRGFMIQGGDPEGTGKGGPGYTFENEIDPGLSHDRPGIVSMANAGPNTNGSQFFITVAKVERLDKKYSIFGIVVDGYKTVETISKVKTDRLDRPRKDVIMTKVEIKRE